MSEETVTSSNRNIIIAGSALVFVHLVFFSIAVDAGTNLVLFCVNLFALWNGFRYAARFSFRRAAAYAAGYAALFMLFFVVGNTPLLFAAFGILYAAAFPNALLLGCLVILVISISVITPYWIPATILLCALFAIALKIYPQRGMRFQVVSFTMGFMLIAGILLPLVYLMFQISPQTLMVTMQDGVFGRALLTSLLTSTISTLIILLFGVPLAYAMARLEFAGKRLIESLIDLPIVVPQSVAGIALLVFLGPKTPVGEFLETRFGIEIAGSYLGIIACQIFVSSPFLIRSAMNAFRDAGPALESVSRTLGAGPASTFFRVSLPLASGAIFSGCILSWARAISEVGSLMVLAYHPFTVSIYTYDLFVQYGLQEAQPAAVLLVIVCLWGFLALRWLRNMSPLGAVFERRAAR